MFQLYLGITYVLSDKLIFEYLDLAFLNYQNKGNLKSSALAFQAINEKNKTKQQQKTSFQVPLTFELQPPGIKNVHHLI